MYTNSAGCGLNTTVKTTVKQARRATQPPINNVDRSEQKGLWGNVEAKIQGGCDDDGGKRRINARHVNGRNAETMQCADWMVRLDFVAVVELEAPFLADATVERHPLVEVAHLWRSRSGRALVENEELVQHAENCKSNNESEDSDKEPVLGEPEDDLDIGPVPAVSEVVGEETPGVVVVFLWEEDAHAVLVDGAGVVVMSPHKTEEERSGGGHDGDVGERPATVVVGQGVDGLEEERVTRDRAHGIV